MWKGTRKEEKIIQKRSGKNKGTRNREEKTEIKKECGKKRKQIGNKEGIY